jgi:hypothetical protein
MGRRWAVALVVATLVSGAVVLFLPSESTSCVSTDGGSMRCGTDRHTLLSTEGPTLLIPLGIAVATAAIPLVLRSRRGALVTAVLLTVFMVLAAMSIGIFFVPAVVLAWVAYSTSASSAAK